MRYFLPFFMLFFGKIHAQIPVYTSFDSFEKEWLQVNNDTAYLFNFWATWCKPCVEELPYFVQFSKEKINDKTKVVFVSLDTKRDHEKLIQFVQKNLQGQKVVHLADSRYNDWIDRVDPSWSGSIPASLYLIGKKKEFHEKQFEDVNDLHTGWLHFLKQ